MLHALSTSEAKQYRDNGFFIRRHVFQDQEIFKFIEAVEISVIEAKELAKKGKAYILDGKRFVDIDYLTV